MTDYISGKDYPFESGQEYDNLIAYGVPVTSLRHFRQPGNFTYYKLYADVYLDSFDSQSQRFYYKYVYWYCEVVARPKYVRPKDGATKFRTITYATVPGSAILFNDRIVKLGNYEVPEDISEWLRTKGYGFPGTNYQTSVDYLSPADLGWKPQVIGSLNVPGQDPIPEYGPAGIPGNGGSTRDSYFDRDGSTNETRINNGGDTEDGNPADGDADFTPQDPTPDEPELDPLPSINWFNKPTRWNPPLIGTATGAYVPVYMGDDEVDLSEPRTRDIFLGEYGIGARIRRKGYLRQYIVNAEEFRVSTGEVETDVEDPDWDNNQTMFDMEKGWVYGFRFHYNPEQVAMNTQPIVNIDPAFLISGKEKAFPAGADGATIQFPIYLNRIEDVSFLRKNNYADITNLYKGYSKKDKKLLNNGKMPIEDRNGLRDRGTGYDLEFLYRTAMGRPFPTALRGDTADLGVILGMPMQLKLSKHLNYVGRLTSLSYTHAMFSEEMVPMFTVVNLGFSRVPDARSFNGAKE